MEPGHPYWGLDILFPSLGHWDAELVRENSDSRTEEYVWRSWACSVLPNDKSDRFWKAVKYLHTSSTVEASHHHTSWRRSLFLSPVPSGRALWLLGGGLRQTSVPAALPRPRSFHMLGVSVFSGTQLLWKACGSGSVSGSAELLASRRHLLPAVSEWSSKQAEPWDDYGLN